MVTRPGTGSAYQGHRRVLIDTNIWLYHLEGNHEYGLAAAELLTAVEQGAVEGIVSDLTLMEIQVRPLRLNRQDVADEYEILLDHFPHLVVAPVARGVLATAAMLRAKYSLKPPDAIILATGIRHGATLAVSNDRQWQRVTQIRTTPLQASC